MKKLFDHDPFTGITQYHHYDELTDKTTIESVQDVSKILDANNELRKDDDYKREGIKNDFMHAARIPIIVIEKWLKEEGIDVYNKDHWPAVKRKLNSAEYSYLRTTSGTI